MATFIYDLPSILLQARPHPDSHTHTHSPTLTSERSLVLPRRWWSWPSVPRRARWPTSLQQQQSSSLLSSPLTFKRVSLLPDLRQTAAHQAEKSGSLCVIPSASRKSDFLSLHRFRFLFFSPPSYGIYLIPLNSTLRNSYSYLFYKIFVKFCILVHQIWSSPFILHIYI